MREYKFRAWSKKEKRMVYLANSESSSTHLQMNNHSWGIFEPDKEDYDGACSLNYGYGDTLMQYTGLHDKNGKEIYEGDIWRVEEENITVVCEYNENKGMFEWVSYGFKGELLENGWNEEAGGFGEFDRESMDEYHASGLEIIGNIFENPELLESEV